MDGVFRHARSSRILLALASFALFACGGSQGPAQSPQQVEAKAKAATPPPDGPAVIQPAALTSPQAKIRASMLDAINNAPANANLCTTGSAVPQLVKILDAKADFDRAAGTQASDALRRLASAAGIKDLPKAPNEADAVRSVMDATRVKVSDLEKDARNDAGLRAAAEVVVGTECDAECIDAVVNACTSPDTRQTRRSDAGVGGTLVPGLSWQATLATGVANFLKERALSEATLWAVNEVQKRLCDAKLKIYFEHTCRLVEQTPGRVAQLTGAMAMTAIRADLERLPVHIFETYYFDKEPTPNTAKEDRFAVEHATQLLWQLLDGIRRGDAPMTLLAGLASNPHLMSECPDPRSADSLACTLRRIGGLVGMLGGAAAPMTRASEEPDFRALALQLKEGLKKLQANRKLCPGSAAEVAMGKTGHRVTAQPRSNDLAICALQDPDAGKLEDLLRMTHRLSQRLRQYAEQPAMPNEQRLIASGEILEQTVVTMRSAEDIWAIDSTSSEHWKDLEQVLAATNQILRGQRPEGALRLLDLIAKREASCEKRRDSRECVPTKLLKHATLVVDIASAQKPEDVQAALEAAAAPVGSWRVKRSEAPLATVTALIGGTGGHEMPANGDHPGQWAAGVTAMVGIDTTWVGGKAGTLGMFFSLVDVGQLLTTPVQPPSREVNAGQTGRAEGGADFELVQLLAPGLHFRYGVLNTPLVVGAGYSVSPRLRKYELQSQTSTTVTDDNFTVHRIMGFIAIDVTVFPL
jgi:hypothetical protein